MTVPALSLQSTRPLLFGHTSAETDANGLPMLPEGILKLTLALYPSGTGEAMASLKEKQHTLYLVTDQYMGTVKHFPVKAADHFTQPGIVVEVERRDPGEDAQLKYEVLFTQTPGGWVVTQARDKVKPGQPGLITSQLPVVKEPLIGLFTSPKTVDSGDFLDIYDALGR